MVSENNNDTKPLPVSATVSETRVSDVAVAPNQQGLKDTSDVPTPMTAHEMEQTRQQIEQYNAYPEIQGAIARLVTANQQNPDRLTALVRELMDQIDSVKANPHLRQPVSAEIAQAVEEIRKVELEKPDPLNLLRGSVVAPEEEKSFNPLGLVGAIVGVGVLAQQNEPKELKLPIEDMGPSTAAIAMMGLSGGFKPLEVPDVRDLALVRGAGGRTA